MHFVLPRFADSCVVRNNEAAGGRSLFISFAEGEAEIEIAAAETCNLNDAAISEVFIRSSGGTAAFSFYFAIVNAEMA
jgi:hypothetical protein